MNLVRNLSFSFYLQTISEEVSEAARRPFSPRLHRALVVHGLLPLAGPWDP